MSDPGEVTVGSLQAAGGAGNATVAVETLILFGLRASFFFLAQQYLSRSLYSDLRQVIRDETSTVSSSDAHSNSAYSPTGHESPDDDYYPSSPSPLAANGNQSFRDQLYNLRPGGNLSSASVLLPTTSSSSTTSTTRPASTPPGNSGTRRSFSSSLNPAGAAAERSGSGAPRGGRSRNKVAPRLTGAVFCVTVSECITLFALILFGGILSDEARLLNWNFSLGSVLGFIVVVIPVGMCLMFSMRAKSSTSLRRKVIFTAIPFTAWLVALFWLGDYVSKALGVEPGSWSNGLYASALDRICVPGTILIAMLSGGAAVNSAWEAFEWRERFRGEVVTEGHINAAIRSLQQTRTDLAARQAEMDALESSNDASTQGFFSKMFTSSPHAAKIKALRAEIGGLEVMESQMNHDLQLMRRRKSISEMGKTWTGTALQAMGWLFSIYCVYRILVSCINLIFGHAVSSGGKRNTDPADLLSAVLGRIANAFAWNIDVATWSKIAGLLLIGSIILVNLNFVLSYVSRVFKATSAGNSASFMLLFLSQLMAVYLLTSLISLPSGDPERNKAAVLLNTLPAFQTFSRLFDIVFLLAASAVFAIRWIQRKVRVEENLGLQDFV